MDPTTKNSLLMIMVIVVSMWISVWLKDDDNG